MIRALLARPGRWPAALRAGWSLAPNRWWTRPPFLPLPDRRWLHFRLVTAYGGRGRAEPRRVARDLITWLEWRQAFPRPR